VEPRPVRRRWTLRRTWHLPDPRDDLAAVALLLMALAAAILVAAVVVAAFRL
jgi:hypothetical protein